MQTSLVDRVRAECARPGAPEQRAQAVADLVRRETGRRWVGIYAVTPEEVVNLAWSGPAAPAHPRFPVSQGLTSSAISERATIVSNDVARDPRYLTALESTGSELIVPVVVGGEVVGTLDVEDARVGAFDGDDQRLFEEIAAALAGLCSGRDDEA